MGSTVDRIAIQLAIYLSQALCLNKVGISLSHWQLDGVRYCVFPKGPFGFASSQVHLAAFLERELMESVRGCPEMYKAHRAEKCFFWGGGGYIAPDGAAECT